MIFALGLPFLCFGGGHADVNLEDDISDFVIETEQIKIPGYPHAFNPSVLRWNGNLLMSFRVIPDPKNPYISNIGIVLLDTGLNVISKPYILDLLPAGADPSVPSRAEDARLVEVGGRIYMIYGDNRNAVITKGGFRVYVTELVLRDGQFLAKEIEVMTRFPQENPLVREKSWVPFDFQNELLLAYSLSPHLIFRPLFNGGECESFTRSESDTNTDWEWGILRGGTPGVKIDSQHYLAFFHSSEQMKSVHSEKAMPHYFIGAYTFSTEPPFTITQMSIKPIVGKGFYSGKLYERYWGSVRAVFPGGFIFDENYIWVFYGRQDHEVCVIKLDKRGLLNSLLPVNNEERQSRPGSNETDNI